MIDDVTSSIIEDFGEVVTVHPQGDYEPEDSTDPVYFERSTSSESSFDVKVRVYSMPSEEILNEYGFENDAEFAIYTDENIIDIGDNVEYDGQVFTARRMEKKQMGEGAYRFVYELIGVE